METGKTYIVKGMVCSRCVTILRNLLEQHNVEVNHVALGRVGLGARHEGMDESRFANIISSLGFTLGVNKNSRITEQVKAIISGYFDELDPSESKKKFSEIITARVNMSYDAISAIFSAHEKTTIENYIILKRIDLVKKYLDESDLSLTEIAYRTGFSSVHHLSRQFKELTAVAPSVYRSRIHPSKNPATNAGNDIILSGI